MLNTNQALQHLDISNIDIKDSQVKILADAFRINKNLTELSICTEDLGANGLQILSNALKENTTIKKLNYSFLDCYIDDYTVHVMPKDPTQQKTSLMA